VLVHPLPPVRATWASAHARFFAALERARASFGEDVVIMGDLNATPWSYALRTLLDRTGLRDSRRGFGLGASWPTWSPFVRIPIDQLLLGGRVEVLAREVGPELGSDHFPLRATVALAR
jgi:endonuclease/exonuclease/phosphatase (EEP) superfamily protein YafD